MPDFLFAANDPSGQPVQGKATAADMATAVAYVASLGYTLLHIELLQPGQEQANETVLPVAQTGFTTQMQSGAASNASAALPPSTSPTANVEPLEKPAVAQTEDILKADAAKRRKLETDLSAMGMSPDEIKRLVNANAATHEADPNSIFAGLALTAGPGLATAAPQKTKRTSAASLEQFAAQLNADQAKKNKEAVKAAAVNLQLPDFRDATIQDTLKAEPLLREASMLRRTEKFKIAEQKVREAIQYTPRDPSALELLGDILQGVGRVDEALAAYRRAVEADAKRTSAEKKYGDLLMRQRNWDIGDPELVTVNGRAAMLMSLLFPGVGQLLNGSYIKCAAFFALDAVCLYLLLFSHIPIVASRFHLTTVGMMGIGLLVLTWFGSAVDLSLTNARRSRL